MKKLARLDWIRRTFGSQYVQPFRACFTWDEIVDAIGIYEHLYGKWSIRTDYRSGTQQGYQLPFIFAGNRKEAKRVWKQNGQKLVYMVIKTLLYTRLQAVAQRVGSQHIFIEWNEAEKDVPQRHMYRHPENLRQLVFGPGSRAFVWGCMRRVINPRRASWHRFDEVYRLMLATDVDEITFSVTPEGSVVIW